MNKTITNVLSVAAIIISMVALAQVHPTDGQDFDYIGAMVGVLSLIVTILIGYQIYTVINVKEELKEVKEIRTEIDYKLQEKVDELTTDYRDDLKKSTPLILSLASAGSGMDFLMIESAFRAYQESKPQQMAKDLSFQTIILIFAEIAKMKDQDKIQKKIDDMAKHVTYKQAVEFYTDFAKIEDKGVYGVIEPLVLSLLAVLPKDEQDGNKE